MSLNCDDILLNVPCISHIDEEERERKATPMKMKKITIFLVVLTVPILLADYSFAQVGGEDSIANAADAQYGGDMDGMGDDVWEDGQIQKSDGRGNEINIGQNGMSAAEALSTLDFEPIKMDSSDFMPDAMKPTGHRW